MTDTVSTTETETANSYRAPSQVTRAKMDAEQCESFLEAMQPKLLRVLVGIAQADADPEYRHMATRELAGLAELAHCALNEVRGAIEVLSEDEPQ